MILAAFALVVAGRPASPSTAAPAGLVLTAQTEHFRFYAASSGKKGRVLKVDVRQTEGVFVFPLWIEWRIGTATRREMVVVDAPSASFRLRLDGQPTRVRINPDKAVPGKFD